MATAALVYLTGNTADGNYCLWKSRADSVIQKSKDSVVRGWVVHSWLSPENWGVEGVKVCLCGRKVSIPQSVALSGSLSVPGRGAGICGLCRLTCGETVPNLPFFSVWFKQVIPCRNTYCVWLDQLLLAISTEWSNTYLWKGGELWQGKESGWLHAVLLGTLQQPGLNQCFIRNHPLKANIHHERFCGLQE